MLKLNSIRPVVLIQYRLVTDRQMSRQTHDDSKCRASMAPRGETPLSYCSIWLSYQYTSGVFI